MITSLENQVIRKDTFIASLSVQTIFQGNKIIDKEGKVRMDRISANKCRRNTDVFKNHHFKHPDQVNDMTRQ